MRRRFAAAWRACTGWLLDPACAGCGGELEGSRGPACRACLRALEAAARTCCPACSVPMPESGSGLVCGACRQRPAFPPVAAPRAHEGVARALVLALKAGRRPEIAETLARATAADARVEAALSSADLIVPVPAHPLRRRERGYDQAELIARELGRQALPGRRRPRVARLLRRSAGEPPQSGRGRSARRRGPARSLRPAWLAQRRARGRRIVLVDDVVTTGASLRAAGRLLQRLGAVDVCAVAVTRTGRDR